MFGQRLGKIRRFSPECWNTWNVRRRKRVSHVQYLQMEKCLYKKCFGKTITFSIFNNFCWSLWFKCLKLVFKVVPEIAGYFDGYHKASFVGTETRLKLSARSNNFGVDLKGVLLDPIVQYFNECENKESFINWEGSEPSFLTSLNIMCLVQIARCWLGILLSSFHRNMLIDRYTLFTTLNKLKTIL